jgi:hypothetical protein
LIFRASVWLSRRLFVSIAADDSAMKHVSVLTDRSGPNSQEVEVSGAGTLRQTANGRRRHSWIGCAYCMSEETSPHHDSIYWKDEISPDGRWRVIYDYLDGEKSPLIISPRVIDVATGRVLLDLWRCALNGEVGDFASNRFRVRISDPYGPTVLEARVDAATETFVIPGETATPCALADLHPVARAVFDRVRQKRLAPHERSAPPSSFSIWERIKQWMTGINS